MSRVDVEVEVLRDGYGAGLAYEVTKLRKG
jgi:hypothetical protein